MKAILPWVVAVLAIGGAAVLFKSNQTQRTELEKLRLDAQELETVRAELNQLKSEQIPAAEITQLRKDREDLLRLRNEVTKLRNESQQLTKQAQLAQSALAGAQAETQRAQQQAQTLAQNAAQLFAQNKQQTDLLNGCINNLRQLDGAKQQWALEHQKTAEALPTPQDIAAYLKEQSIPNCPAAGKYTLNAVSVPPTCSIPGHVMPTSSQ